jgi:hypothetical protein
MPRFVESLRELGSVRRNPPWPTSKTDQWQLCNWRTLFTTVGFGLSNGSVVLHSGMGGFEMLTTGGTLAIVGEMGVLGVLVRVQRG